MLPPTAAIALALTCSVHNPFETQVAPEGAASAALHQLQLDASNCDTLTADLASALTTAMLLNSFASGDCCTVALQAPSWLGSLTQRAEQVSAAIARTHSIVAASLAFEDLSSLTPDPRITYYMLQLQEAVQQAQGCPEEATIASLHLAAVLMAIDVNIKQTQHMHLQGFNADGANTAGACLCSVQGGC